MLSWAQPGGVGGGREERGSLGFFGAPASPGAAGKPPPLLPRCSLALGIPECTGWLNKDLQLEGLSAKCQHR